MQAPEPLSKRKRGGQALSPDEPTVKFLVRLPKSLRERIQAAARDARELGVKNANASALVRHIVEAHLSEAAELYAARERGV